MPSDSNYYAPSEKICNFLSETLPKLSEFVKLDTQDLAKRLLELYEGKKSEIRTSEVADSFPWLYQVDLIDYEFQYLPKGGNHLFIWRITDTLKIKRTLAERPDVIDGALREHKSGAQRTKKKPAENGGDVEAASEPKKKKKKKKKKPDPPPASASEPDPGEEDPPASSKKKKRKKCCDNPRIVKSKSTGKRRCKNCGTKLKPKKKKD